MKSESVSSLHNLASNPPECDPFSFEGAIRWKEWSQECRAAEKALIEEGVEL